MDGVAEANRRGIEVVVTDHHLPADTLPAARVIVNPNQPDCGFPSKNLAGVGVMFYVLLALRAELRTRRIVIPGISVVERMAAEAMLRGETVREIGRANVGTQVTNAHLV